MPTKAELLNKKKERNERIAHMVVEKPVVKQPKKKSNKKPVRKFLVVDDEVDLPKEEKQEELSEEEIPFETVE